MASGGGQTVIVAVGDEILGGFIVDTNSQWLAERLREAGYPVERIEVVGDREDAIVAAVARALAEPSVSRVLVCGGVGPTPDDRTLGAVAQALGRPLEVHPVVLSHIQGIVDRMHAAGWVPTAELSAGNRRMTAVPAGALVLTNRRGMAPGLAYEVGEGIDGARWLLVLPGVPRELRAIVEEEAIPRLFDRGRAVHVTEARYRNAIEADLVEPMTRLGVEYPDVAVGSYPQSDRRELVIRLRGTDGARVQAALRRLLEMRPLEPPRDRDR